MWRPACVLWAATPQLGLRHQPTGLNTHFDGSQPSFSDYITHCRAMIAQARYGDNCIDLEKIVDGNAPFELKPAGNYQAVHGKPYRRGVLLIHGLTDSPYFMRHLAEIFQEDGFRVMAVLLPGHGTRPGDLLEVTWQEWAKAVAYGADRLAEEVDGIYLAGFSAGGVLSIYQSLIDDRVRGLFLFSPALRITSRAARADLHKLYSWLMPSAKWVSICPDKGLYKYESIPKNAAAQMYALTKKLSSMLREHEVGIPVFTAASQDDATANSSATLKFMAHASHPSSRLVLYTTDTRKPPPGIPAEKLELVNSAVPEQKILSSAHTAIVLPPDDAYYGVAGEYSNCTHYYPGDMEKFEACISRHGEIWQGEITEYNLKVGTLRRLMVNPSFAALKASMKRFIDDIQEP